MLNSNLYRYKGKIYSKLKEYPDEKVPLNLQAKEFQSTLLSDKQTGLREGYSRDAKGRIRKTKDIFNLVPTKKERAVLKNKITLVETVQRIKKKVGGKTKNIFKKTYDYFNEQGQKVTKREFDIYNKKLLSSGQITNYRTVYNQSIISQAIQFLKEGKKVVLKNGNKKTVLDKNNLEKFIKDTKKMLAEFYKKAREKENYEYVVFTANEFGDNYVEIDISKTVTEQPDGYEVDDDEEREEKFNFKSFYK